MMRIKPLNLLLLGMGLLMLTGCPEQSYEDNKNQRTEIASKSQDGDPIVIGIAWKSDEEDDSFLEGVKLAVKEVNKKGGVLDSPLEIIINDGESAYHDPNLSVAERQQAILDIADGFAANPHVVAVIGHSSSPIAMMASVVYQNAGILFLSPLARYSKITGHNFDYTFRTLLTNNDSAMQIAEYAAHKGYKNVAVLHSRDNSSTELAEAFSSYAVDKHGINIAFRRSFFEESVNIISMIIDLKNVQQLDAIFIASSAGELSAKVYEQSRNMGVKQPFIGGESLDTKVFLSQVRQWESSGDMQKSAIPSLYNAQSPMGQAYIKSFKEEYGLDEEPDYASVLGHDTVILLAHAIQLAQSTIPIEIATALRYMDPCTNTTGKYEFQPNGDLKSKRLFFRHLVKRQFVYEQVPSKKVLPATPLATCNDIDRDHDTIPDKVDACPDSTELEKVKGIKLQGATKGCPIDVDEDDVADYKDSCLNNTKREISEGVDTQGCPVDSDKDGVADYMDDDIDGDTIFNTNDNCPKNTTAELVLSINRTGKQIGCPLDTDTDLVPDYLDACKTNTVAEIALGVDAKGCPADNDHDGVVDFQDQCIKSPTGMLMAKQGCEALDTTSTQKPDTAYFESDKMGISTQGISLLGELLAKSNLELLKNIKIIGYSTQKNAARSRNQLLTIADFFQQKKVPMEKIETTVIETDVPNGTPTTDPTKVGIKSAVAKKINTIEIVFSQFKPDPAAQDASKTDGTEYPTHP
ncbi:MAG: ABC transporter substrate-binding protein [Methylococcales bacterium]|nr:ABC transporter substrate-binding protein [Methylococcales bacterium]